jgi:Predicted ATPase
MFGGVLGLLTELAAAGPVLLVLEDLHWADTSTRDLVTFLSRMLHRERVALIGHLPDRLTCTGGTRSGPWWPSCSGCPASSRSTSSRWLPRPWPSI